MGVGFCIKGRGFNAPFKEINTMIKTGLILSLLVILASISALLVQLEPEKSFGQVGLACNIATSSNITIINGEERIVSASSTRGVFSCVSTIIGNHSADINLSFHDNFTPSSTEGIPQLASTTEVYPAEQFGCGQISAFGLASSNLTVAVCN